MVDVMVFIIMMFLASQAVTSLGAQQKNLGIENGFIEEMMSGQKSGQALVHERESIE